MNVSAVIVTRGDVDLAPIVRSLPDKWEVVAYDNGAAELKRWSKWRHNLLPEPLYLGMPDLSVYGRYAAIEHASGDLIFTVDDDVIVSDPQAIVDEWNRIDEFRHVQGKKLAWETYADYVVCNMPQEFRHDGYTDSCLVGFGACFHRDAPVRAFAKWGAATLHRDGALEGETTFVDHGRWSPLFLRTCDVVFTTLTPRVLVDVPKVNREFAEDASRMYRQPGHVEERQRMLELARRVRDA